MSKNSMLWTVLVLIIVVVGAVLVSKGNDIDTDIKDSPVVTDPKDSDAVTSTDPTLERDKFGNIIISYTASGFVPKYLSLAKGTAVTFRNDSGTALQISPADAVNEPYAAFDQNKSSIGAGGTFSYTFLTVGSYTYFNQNKQTDIGRVTVR